MLNSRWYRYLILAAALLLVPAAVRTAAAVDPSSWVWRNPTPQGNHLHGAAYGKGQFVAVGEYGMIETSRDGSTWAVRSSGTGTALISAAAGPAGYVAVGYDGVIVSSTDGIAWTVQTSVTPEDLYGVTWGPNGFIAVGLNGTILQSSDGAVWNTIPPVNSISLLGVTYGAAGYVAVSGNTSLVSTDGSTWTYYDLTASNVPLWGITYGNGTYVAVAPNNNVATSTDGAIWTTYTISGATYLYGVAYGSGVFVAVDENGLLWSSPDGATWTQRTSSNYGGGVITGVAYGAGTFVAVSGFGKIQTSQSGTTWALVNSGTVNSLLGIAWGSNGLVAVGGGNDRPIWTSPTGTLWSQNALSTPSSGIISVMFGNGQYVATSDGGLGNSYILSSITGSAWQLANTSTTTYNGVVSNGTGTYVAVGRYGKIATSPDAVTWTPVTLNISVQTNNNFNAITFGNGNFVSVGQCGFNAFMVYTSSDGTNWAAHWPAAPSLCLELKGVAYGNNTFVAVGASGSVLTASDTDVATWTQQSFPTNEILNAVAYGNGYFVAAGNSGNIYWSHDNGVSWTRSPNHSSTFSGVTYDSVNDKFFVAGWAGSILQTGYTLDVVKAGNGTGGVISSDLSIVCGTMCSGSYDQGATVTLTATPGVGGSTFDGWSCGSCSGTGPCTVTLNANTICTANFTDAVAPTVSGMSPVPGASNVLVGTSITAAFSEDMDPATINNSTFTVSNGVVGTVTYNPLNFTATFIPSGSLVSATTYTVTLIGVTDLGGNALAGITSWSFTTEPPHTFSGDINAAVGTTGLTWTTGGISNWFSQTTTYYDSGAAAQSGDVNDYQSTWMQTTIIGPMNLSFWWMVSSESGYDWLSFAIDGATQAGRISGGTGWAQMNYFIPAGAHTLTWVYSKDGSVSNGLDAGFVDKIELIPPDYTPPTTTATPAGTVFTSSPQDITLTCDDGTGFGCAGIYYTTDGTAPTYPPSGTTQTGAGPVIVNISANSAPTILKFFSRDSAGNVEAIKTETYFIDLSLITGGSVLINTGAPNTADPNTTLALTCTESVSSCSQMKFSNDGYTWSAPISFVTGTNWTLAPGDGPKTVYAMFSDSTGTWSRPYADTIALDANPPMNGAWHWRKPAPQGNDLYGAAYGNSTYVAVGALGTILTSPDGLTWTNVPSITYFQLSNVTFGNNTFVAVGTGGTILTSADGLSWQSRTSDTTWNLQDVTFSNSTFVAIGSGGTILTSPDGITWTSRTSGTMNDLIKITYGNSIFVAVGSAGTILTSADGATWTSRASTTTVDLGGVAFGNGVFVIVQNAGNTILTSSDGSTWTSATAGASYTAFTGVAFGNNAFVTAGYYAEDFLTSLDGTGWTAAGIAPNALNVMYVNSMFMSVGTAGAIHTSTDGLTWSPGMGVSTTTLYGVAFGNNTFVAVGVGAILRSVDGASTWADTNAVGSSDYEYGVGFGNGTFVSLQNRSEFLTSTTGTAWTMYSTGYSMPENNFSVTYGNKTFVAVGNWHQIFTSSDGTSWTLWYPPITQYLHGVAYGNNTFVAVGGGGTILTSTDGFNWTVQASGTTLNLSSVAYGNNTFVAVGGTQNSVLLSSPDGITWTPRVSGTSAWLNGVTYANGTFVAVGNSGTIRLSSDGITWKGSRSGVTNNLNSVTSDNTTFVVVGEKGAILQSDQYLGSALYLGINNYAPATDTTAVTLNLSCMDAGSGCAQMQFSNDNITYSDPVAYATTAPWDLTPGGGSKTVFVMYSDLSGSWSAPISANIVLDTTAPLTKVSTPGGLYNAPQSVALMCDDGAGGGCSQTFYTLDGSDPNVDSAVYSGNIAINANTTLKFYSVDIYGYSEAIRTAVYTIDMILPTTIVSPPAGIYTVAQDVTMTTDEPSTIYYTTDGTTPTYPPTGSTLFGTSPVTVNIAATATLQFFAIDLAGNVEPTIKTAAYIIDLTTITVAQTSAAINNNDLYTNATSATLALTCTDPDFTCTNMMFSNDGMSWSEPVSYGVSTAWALAPGDGLKTVFAMFQDHAGNWSRPYIDTITLDTVPPTSAGSGAPELWYLRNPVPQGAFLNGASFGNNVYVSVGDAGALFTSTDGNAWTSSTSGTNNDFSSVTFGNNIFVAVGSGGTILTSTTGTTWTGRVSGTTNYLSSITFSNSMFVVVGDAGTVLTSSDGITWTSRTSGTINYLSGITYGAGIFAAVGDVGTVLTSSDGITWTGRVSGTPNFFYSVAYGNGTFVALENPGTLFTSPDGITWTSSASGTVLTLFAVTYGNGAFVAVGGSSTIMTSSNGFDWTTGVAGVSNQQFHGAAYVNNTFLVVGNGVILTSSDTIIWNNSAQGITNDLRDTAFGNGTFVAVGTSGTILTSSDGASWTTRVSNTPYDLYGAAYGNGIFVAVGAPEECGYSTAYSDDGGVTWTSHYGCLNGDTLRAVAFGNNTFVAVGDYGATATSTNGIDWTDNDPAAAGYAYLLGVSFGNGIFVAVGQSGVILTSSDGIDWTSRGPGSRYLKSVAYGNNTFVVVGDAGEGGRSIFTSSDGMTWQDMTPAGTDWSSTPYGITFGNGEFVAVGEGGTILTSTDGIAWNETTAWSGSYLYGVTYGNNTFVAAGQSGTVLQSNMLTGLKNLINRGAQFTNTASVTLTLSCIDFGSGCAEMQFSNDNTTWDTSIPYGTSAAWTLITGDGPKTVYVKFKDNAGNWSEVFNSTIILDSAYVPTHFTLTVVNVDPSNGLITSDCGGDCIPDIQCGNGSSACSAAFSAGGAVTLSETPNAGMLFTGWTGPGISCTGSSCTLTLVSDMTVTVGFVPQGDCSNAIFSLTPWSASTTFSGGAGSVIVSQLTGSIASCRWLVASSNPWLTPTSGMVGGPGNGAVDYSAAPGPDLLGTIAVADQTFTMIRTGSVGGLDPAFNAGKGFATYPTGTSPNTTYITAAALQSDSKVVMTGYYYYYDGTYNVYSNFVGRYNTDGTLDNTFGSGGIATFATTTLSAYASAVAIQSDGNIVVAGSTDHSALLTRLTTTGLPDPGFGVNGLVTYNSGPTIYDQFSGIAIQADGSIVAAGYSYDAVSSAETALVSRFTATGLPDVNFGTSGMVSFNTGTNTRDYLTALGIDTSDGSIVAAGTAYDTVTNIETAMVIRLSTTGLMDPGFGTSGIVSFSTPSTSSNYYALTLQPDGNILAGGYTYDIASGINHALVTRVTSTGLLDANFGNNGVVSFSTGTSHYDYFNSLALQPDGKIVAAGSTNDGYSNDHLLALRLNAAGSLDPDFGYNGMVVFDSGSANSDYANAVLIQPDTKIVIAGTTYATQTNGLVMRLLGSGLPVTPYTITATQGANGAISPSGAVSVDVASDQTFTITPDTGYHILDVVIDNTVHSLTSTYTFTNVTTDHTIAATFAINTFTITASSGANGTITPDGATSVTYNSSQNYSIAPYNGYHVADVLVDGVSVSAVTSYNFTNVTTAHTISATFASSDTTAPVFSSTAPAAGTLVNNAAIGYDLSEELASGTVTFARVSGANDPAAPHVYTFTTPDMTAGPHSVNTGITLVNGTVYDVIFSGMDLAGNNGNITNANVIYDISAASVTIDSPLSNSRVNTSSVSYSLNEAISAGNIIITWTNGTNDALSPYLHVMTSSERTAGSHMVDLGLALVNNAIYSISFTGVKDAAGNDTAPITSINVMFDSQSVAVTKTSPARKSIATAATVGYTLSEEAQYGKVTFTWTGGSNVVDASLREYTFQAAELTAGAHPAVDTKLSLVDGAFYTVTFSFIDKAGNPATTVSNALIYFDSNYGKGAVGNVVNEDGLNIVNDADVARIKSAMGARPGSPNWNPACDLNKDNVIDAKDLMILNAHYGETL